MAAYDDKFTVIHCKAGLREELEPIIDGRLKQHAIILGPEGRGKTHEVLRLLPMSDEESLALENGLDSYAKSKFTLQHGAAALEANIRHRDRVRKWLEAAERDLAVHGVSRGDKAATKGEKLTENKYGSHKANLAAINSQIAQIERENEEARVLVATHEAQQPDRKYVWFQGAGSVRGMLDRWEKFSDYDWIVLNDVPINDDEWVEVLKQALEKFGSRRIDWRKQGGSGFRLPFSANFLILANAINLSKKSEADLRAILDRASCLKYVPALDDLMDTARGMNLPEDFLAVLTADYDAGRINSLNLRQVRKASEKWEAGLRAPARTLLESVYNPGKFPDADHVKGLLRFWSRHCGDDPGVFNFGEARRRAGELFRGKDGEERFADAVDHLKKAGVLLPHHPERKGSVIGRPKYFVFRVDVLKAMDYLNRPDSLLDASPYSSLPEAKAIPSPEEQMRRPKQNSKLPSPPERDLTWRKSGKKTWTASSDDKCQQFQIEQVKGKGEYNYILSLMEYTDEKVEPMDTYDSLPEAKEGARETLMSLQGRQSLEPHNEKPDPHPVPYSEKAAIPTPEEHWRRLKQTTRARSWNHTEEGVWVQIEGDSGFQLEVDYDTSEINGYAIMGGFFHPFCITETLEEAFDLVEMAGKLTFKGTSRPRKSMCPPISRESIHPVGKPGPAGQTFAMLAEEDDAPFAFLLSQDFEAAEAYRLEHYSRRATRIEPWDGDLPQPANPSVRKMLIRDIRNRAKVRRH